MTRKPDNRREDSKLDGEPHSNKFTNADPGAKQFGRRVAERCENAKAQHQNDAENWSVLGHERGK